MADEAKTDQAEQAPAEQEEEQGIFKEFISFLLHEKKWWLIPLIVILLLLVGLMFLLESSSIAPFVYPLH